MAGKYDAIIKRMVAERAMSGLVVDRPDPDSAGRANVLARQMGVPAETADRNLRMLQQRTEAARAAAVFERNPTIARWANNPRHAAVAADDMTALEKGAAGWMAVRAPYEIKPAVAPEASAWNILQGVGANFTAMVQGVRQIGSDMLTAIGIDAPQRSGVPALAGGAGGTMRATQRAQARVDGASPAFQSRIASGLYGGVSSLIQNAPGLAASVLTGNPLPALAYAGATVGSQSYGKYRARGATPGMAALGGGAEGAVEVATELIPMGHLVSAFGKQGSKQFLREVGVSMLADVPGEQIATLAQDAIDTAIANPDKTWGDYLRERPGAALETLVATLTQGGIVGSVGAVAKHAAARMEQRAQAEDGGAALDLAMADAAGSKTRARDPDAYQALIDLHTDGTPIERVFVPGDVVDQYLQAHDLPEAEADFWAKYRDQIEEARATGGDVVIPTSEVAAHLAGTPAWEAMRDDVRLSPGGMSRREAAAFDEDADLALGEAAAAIDAERAAAEPRRVLFDSMAQTLMNVGYTPDVARTHAEILTARAATRAARLGVPLTGHEFDNLSVAQVLPQALAPIVAADQLDVTIHAMRRARGGKVTAPSLLDWISRQGGIEDRGGDIASMGGATWHRGKPGRRRLIRGHGEQGALIDTGEQQNANTPDELALRAQEAGYFPAGERPTVNDMLEAIGEELRGTPRYAEGPEIDRTRAAADELAAMVDQAGLDPAKATNAQIRDVLERYRRDAAISSDTLYQSQNAPRSEAFKRWFGESKVVNPDGSPRVVYHGTDQAFEAFDPSLRGSATRDSDAKLGFFFSSSRDVADGYSWLAVSDGHVFDTYLSIQNPLVVDWQSRPYRTDRFERHIEDAIAMGHDGVIFENVDDNVREADDARSISNTYVVFEPQQIKAVSNLGSFDPTDARMLYQSTTDRSVVRLDGDEIGAADLPSSDLRQRARSWYDTHLKGQRLPSTVLGGDVQFASSRKAFSTSADPRKLRTFAALPELLNVADYHEARPPRPEKGEKNVRAYHYLEGTVEMAGASMRVGVTVREDNNGRFYYNHSMQDGLPAAPENIASEAGFGDGELGDRSFDQSPSITVAFLIAF